MFEVVYYAVCGNNKSICQSTKEFAEAIAPELGVTAEDIKAKKRLTRDTFVFWGNSCCGGKPRGGNYRSLLPKMISQEGS